jgi:hypothetical protein
MLADCEGLAAVVTMLAELEDSSSLGLTGAVGAGAAPTAFC